MLGSKELKPAKKMDPKSLVKIRSLTAEIFLVWTNVARTNVAWINITTIYVMESPRNLPLRFC